MTTPDHKTYMQHQRNVFARWMAWTGRSEMDAVVVLAARYAEKHRPQMR